MLKGLEELSLDTLARGQLRSQLLGELSRVIAHIEDPTSGDGKRKITVTLTAQPRKDGRVDFSISAKSTLPATSPTEGTLWMSRRAGQLRIGEWDPDQMAIPGTSSAADRSTADA